jgi:hypothetical protein
MTRPVGIVLLVAALVWHLLSGLATAGIVIVHLVGQGVPMPMGAMATIALLIVAPLAAGVAAGGLWLMRRWATIAFAVWGVLLVLETGALLWIMVSLTGIGAREWWVVGFVLAVLTLGVIAAILYVRYVMRPAK